MFSPALIMAIAEFGVENLPKLAKLFEHKPADVSNEDWIAQLQHPSVKRSVDDYIAEAGGMPTGPVDSQGPV